MDFVIIANPTSGTQAAPAMATRVQELLKAAGKRVELRTTTARGDATKMAAEAAASGTPVVIGCGGDGTLQEIALALEGTPTALGILPRVLKGTHVQHPAVSMLTTKFLEIETPDQPQWVCADGESLGQTPCRFEIRPKALQVIVPDSR